MILKNQKFLLDIKCQNLQKVCQLLTQFQVSRHEFEWSATVRFKLVLNSFKICQTVGTIEQKLQQEKVYSRMIKIFFNKKVQIPNWFLFGFTKINPCKSLRLMNWQWGWFCHFLGFRDLSNFLLNIQPPEPTAVKRENYFSVFAPSGAQGVAICVLLSVNLITKELKILGLVFSPIFLLTYIVNLRVLKSNMRYILRYYEELIWSKYCDEILWGKIRTDFIRMNVPMFKVNPNIHYILIASLPGDLNWDNSVNRLLLNPGGLSKKTFKT